jgi:hypothetical protein
MSAKLADSEADRGHLRACEALALVCSCVPTLLAVRGLEPFGKIIETASARRAFAKRRANVAYIAEYREYPSEECRWILSLYLNLGL